MSDNTASEIQKPLGIDDDFDSLPTIPTEVVADDDGQSDGFGGTVTLLQPGNKDPRNLPGSFFFMEVIPRKKKGINIEPELPGRFNALAYDPGFTSKETKEQTEARYKTNPPYVENLTERSKTDNLVNITSARTAISGLLGKARTAYSTTEWYYKNQPVLLTMAFKGADWDYGCPVGYAWTSGAEDTIQIRPPLANQYRPLMRRKKDWRHGFTASVDNNTEHVYLVEYFTPPLQ